MNIAKSFVEYLEDNSIGTFGVNIFIGGVPADGPDKCYWVFTSGGSSLIKNQTGEKVKEYTIQLFYRNTDPEDVYEILHGLEETLNTSDCTQLSGFDTIEIEASLFPTDRDIDSEDRTVGLLQVVVKTYKE